MSKKGYNCIKWEPEHDKFLIENFVTLNNDELATSINASFTLSRTADAVRKQLNKLELRRPKKSEMKLLSKAAETDSFFKHIQKGLQKRKQNAKAEEVESKKIQKQAKEKEWAARVYGVGEKKQDPVRKEDTRELVWIKINNKTRMQVPKGTEKKWIEKFIEKEL